LADITESENKLLNELVKDCITYRLEEKEALQYIAIRHKPVSLSSYKHRKTRVLSEDANQIWLNHLTEWVNNSGGNSVTSLISSDPILSFLTSLLFLKAGGTPALIFSGIEKTLTFMVVSPGLGFASAIGIAIAIMYFFRNQNSSHVNRIFGHLQIVSSLFFSLTHGANDGQKTMGVITALLIAGGMLESKSFVVPSEVILASAFAIALGTFFGGWRIVKTMAFKLTNLRPYQGFCAETAGGVILTSMAWLGIPVSTTHAIAGAIMGVGATKRLSAVRWGVGKRIVYAWIITIPASAAVAALVFLLIKTIF